MFVSVILNSEYFDYASRSKWYLKHLLLCKDNGGVMITHEYLYKNLMKLQSEITESLFASWEMRPFTMEEIKTVKQYEIPDEVFDDLETSLGGRSEMLNSLFSKRNSTIESYFEKIVNQISDDHPGEKIEFVLHPLDAFFSVKEVFSNHKIPIISFSFSAIRKPHGYRETLFVTTINGDLLCSDECEKRYELFKKENTVFPVFDHRELITLIGKTRTLPLLQLINTEPKYEICVCGECFRTQPQLLAHNIHTTDDDLYYECAKLYDKGHIITRQHSLLMDQIKVNRDEVRNDPAAFLLSSKRTVAVCSQIMLKVLLWNRTAIMPRKTVPFGFLCETAYDSEQKVDINGLNYYLFGYLVPSTLVYDVSYWRWRLTFPSEAELYERHLSFLLDEFGVDKDTIMNLRGIERLHYLLECRGCDVQLTDSILSDATIDRINWDVALSRFDVVSNGDVSSYWRLDKENNDNSLTSVLSVKVIDVAGFARLLSVKLNGVSIQIDKSYAKFKYMKKLRGYYSFNLQEKYTGLLTIECTWQYKKIFDNLNS